MEGRPDIENPPLVRLGSATFGTVSIRGRERWSGKIDKA